MYTLNILFWEAIVNSYIATLFEELLLQNSYRKVFSLEYAVLSLEIVKLSSPNCLTWNEKTVQIQKSVEKSSWSE